MHFDKHHFLLSWYKTYITYTNNGSGYDYAYLAKHVTSTTYGSYKKIKVKAIRLLSLREYSLSNLKKKLCDYAHLFSPAISLETVELVIIELKSDVILFHKSKTFNIHL